jgi:lipid II:glycine glycyltransferase (peptidoglycan interpeptide bridge formation enzyme)
VISIKEVTDRKTWEAALLGCKEPSFLQSSSWGDFQEEIGHKVFRLGIYDGAELSGIAQLMVQRSKVGKFLYCPGGPIFSAPELEELELFKQYLVELGKKEKADFVRLDPRVVNSQEKLAFERAGFKSIGEYTQPQCTTLLDLTKTEEQLLANMSDSTRYNIGMTKRRGVVVRQGGDSEITIFLDMLRTTSKKHSLTLPKEHNYHRKQFEVLNAAGLMRLFIAEYESKPTAAALVVFYGDRAYYLHAGNSYDFPKLRAPYLLVWNSIVVAKSAGLKKFDFWGVAETDDPKHEWAGITKFKLSFGGEKVCYDPPLDLPLSNRYLLMKAVEMGRKPLRRLSRFTG